MVLSALRRDWFRRRENRTEPTYRNLLKTQFLQVSYDMLRKATLGFSSTNLIGEDSYGSVYKAMIVEGVIITTVAVKVLNLQRRRASESFKAECQAFRNIRHRNIVKVLSCCSSIDFQGNDFKAMIYEFLPNGSLEKRLHPGDQGIEVQHYLSLHQRLSIAIDVACALDYLHHHCPRPIVHCNLKPRSVHLDSSMTAHICDFGLSRFPSEKPMKRRRSACSRGITGYDAPEYDLGFEASTKGDVYGYGILLLEMITRRKPTDPMFRKGFNLHSLARMALSSDGRLTDIVDPVLLIDEEMVSHNNNRLARQERIKECLVSAVRIGVACSMESPNQRMDIKNVVHELQSTRNILPQPRTQHSYMKRGKY